MEQLDHPRRASSWSFGRSAGVAPPGRPGRSESGARVLLASTIRGLATGAPSQDVRRRAEREARRRAERDFRHMNRTTAPAPSIVPPDLGQRAPGVRTDTPDRGGRVCRRLRHTRTLASWRAASTPSCPPRSSVSATEPRLACPPGVSTAGADLTTERESDDAHLSIDLTSGSGGYAEKRWGHRDRRPSHRATPERNVSGRTRQRPQGPGAHQRPDAAALHPHPARLAARAPRRRPHTT